MSSVIIYRMGTEFWVEPREDLFSACSALFGPGVEVTTDFFSYVQASGIKSAFRRIAKLTHPDHANCADAGDRERHVRRFIEAKKAYDTLISFVAKRDSGLSSPCRGAAARPAREAGPPPRPEGRFYEGGIPPGKLRFGQFLYYSGRISYGALISALVWQRERRSRVGEIAKRRGWLSEAQVLSILSGGARGERFGEAGVRLGLINREQLASMLAAQRLTQRPIGQYFVYHRHLSSSEVQRLHREFLVHNARISSASRRHGPVQ